MKLGEVQYEQRSKELELHRRVRDRGAAMRSWREMFQAGEISARKFRSGIEKFRAAAMADRREVTAAGIKLFVATPDQP